MHDSAITAETRIVRPEVADACYAFDQGRYWIVERHRDGSRHCRPLPGPPAGAVCYYSRDGFLTWESFTVPGRPGAALLLCVLLAVAAVPAAFVLLSGSVPAVALAVGAAVAALALWQARIEHLRRRDPATVNRIAAASVLYLLATHRRHIHR